MAVPAPESIYDPEVVADARQILSSPDLVVSLSSPTTKELRRQFQEADKDGSGEIDATEACAVFARSCEEGASEEEIRKTAERLRNQLDTDRSGTISFNEYCFRFGRRYQIEHNRRRRNRSNSNVQNSTNESDKLKKEREELEREREAVRQERERLMLEREREALRREREELERQRQASSRSGQSQAFSAGTLVRIQGLQSAPELNGREAKIVNFDEASSRYVVELPEGSTKKIKEINLVLSPGKSVFERFSAAAESARRNLQLGFAKAQVWLAQSGYEWWHILIGVALVVLLVAYWMQPSVRPKPSSRRAERVYRDDSYQGYDDYEDYGGYGSYGSYGNDWGIDFGGMQKYLILGGLAFLCWKGIIPVHRMDWFQLYMLWNMLQSSGILGGGHGGFGRRRRSMFF
ncbi:unnamed protein product [Cladocopium goreaui]|uniref:EF-hand domain-containing protein n=1 Tax=Cladocopium goreaui TaxID=2562237 RepID=A0A9P1FR31_9DINO|nr:unnamed protein product [Cladocopium goreaui]